MSDNLEIGVLFSLIILIFYILGAHIIEIYKVSFIMVFIVIYIYRLTLYMRVGWLSLWVH
jgi:hypothetical protein